MEINAPSIDQLYPLLLHEILTRGKMVEIGRVKMMTKELIGVRLGISDVRRNVMNIPMRKLNYRFMLAEWLWIVAGREDVGTVALYNSQICKYSDDGRVFAGAYGPRLHKQWDYVLHQLEHDESSRQAVATIWTPMPSRSKDIPCTISCQFLIRDKYLHGIFNMRSSDAWLGIPHDVFNFCQIINGLAGQLKIEPGSLVLNLGSSHLYQNNWEEAAACALAPAGEMVISPRLPDLGYRDYAQFTLHNIANLPKSWQAYADALHSGSSDKCLAILKERK